MVEYNIKYNRICLSSNFVNFDQSPGRWTSENSQNLLVESNSMLITSLDQTHIKYEVDSFIASYLV